MKAIRLLLALSLVGVLCGCGANYRWRPSVPAAMRTVAVPTFRNDSELQEIGAIAARQVLREFQREGTFKIRPAGDAALEIQGVARAVSSGTAAYDRRSGLRISGYELVGTFEVSVIDKRAGKVLADNREYTARAAYATGQDQTTAQRDASGRLAEDLARQVVDDVLNLKWEN